MTEQKPEGFPTGLATAVALIVATLAAVGISGDYIPRMVRNEPDRVSDMLLLALAGAALIALTGIFGRFLDKHRWVVALLTALGLLAVLYAAYNAVRLGAASVADREQPRVVLSATTAEGVTTITAEASGAGLATRDDMLVQVIGLKTLPAKLDEAIAACERSRLRETVDPAVAEVLAWQRLGPDSKGNVSGTLKLEVPVGRFGGICAFGALADRRDLQAAEPPEARATAAYLRLAGSTPG